MHTPGFNKISVAEGPISLSLLLGASSLRQEVCAAERSTQSPSVPTPGKQEEPGFLGGGHDERALTSSRAGGSRWAG